MIQNKRQMFVVIVAFILVLLLGTTTYAFFNYTRTGSANTIRTGRIAFNTEQNGVVTLSDLFPIDASGTITASTPGVGSLSIHVTGDTNYEEGIEYLVKAVNVTSSSNGKALPISIQISYEANTGKSIGEADNDYYTNRGGDTSIYKLLTTDKIENNGDIVVGYIAPGQTGIDGYITILAYLDASNIAITDTVEGGDIEVAGYDNGTTSTWIDGRTVFTTSEWNELQANGVSFQIKVESQDGIWVEEPLEPICRRVTDVTQLHTEVCTQTNTYYYCQGDGHGLNENITYGNAVPLGTNTLTPGDAFDCKVSTTGDYTERFYYVSPYYDTNTQSFDNSYATLIYYSDTIIGIESTDAVGYATQEDIGASSCNLTSGCSWFGPVTAVKHLPSSTAWDNVSLKTTSRAILGESVGIHNATSYTPSSPTSSSQTYPTSFSYAGKSARLLTAQELMIGCGLTEVGKLEDGELSNCQYLLERSDYSTSGGSSYGPWLETPVATANNVFAISGSMRAVSNNSPYGAYNGVRPVIDVPVSRIQK